MKTTIFLLTIVCTLGFTSCNEGAKCEKFIGVWYDEFYGMTMTITRTGGTYVVHDGDNPYPCDCKDGILQSQDDDEISFLLDGENTLKYEGLEFTRANK